MLVTLLVAVKRVAAIKQRLRKKYVGKNVQKIAVKKIRKRHAPQTALKLVVKSNQSE